MIGNRMYGRLHLVGALLLAFSTAAVAQQAPVPAGFTSLFDGKTLDGWRGDPAIWSIRDGAITGGSDQPIKANTFLISDQTYGDFEVRFKYRFMTEAGNSGFHFRSGVANEDEYYLGGYQGNVVPRTTAAERIGMLYEEIGRKELVMLGEKARITRRRADQLGNYEIVKSVVGTTNPKETIVASLKPYPEWNEYVIIAHGNHIVEAINGYLAFDATDDDPLRTKEGLFGMQVHFGAASHVQYKDIVVKRLTAPPVIEGRFKSSPATVTPPARSAVATTTVARTLGPSEK